MKNVKTVNMRDNSVIPTLQGCELDNITIYLRSLGIKDEIISFINELYEISGSEPNSDALVYFPSLESGSERIRVDFNMETHVHNLYAIGDGSGWTQGITAAATSGYLAGKHIAKSYSPI